MNSLLDMMKKNRGNKKFTNEPVSRDILVKILEAGAAAPSVVINGVHIYVVDDPAKRVNIHDICVETEKLWVASQPVSVRERITSAPYFDPRLEFLEKAPLLLVVSTRPRDPEIPYAVEAAFMAIGYMLVMAKGLGLTTALFAPSILHEKDADRLNSILELPAGESIQAFLPMGYPCEESEPRVSNAGRNIFHNRFGDKFFTSKS